MSKDHNIMKINLKFRVKELKYLKKKYKNTKNK